MQNLLTKIAQFVEKIKQVEKRNYAKKIEFLRQQTYFWYLRKIQKNNYGVDFPDVFYLSGITINMKALHLADMAINAAIKKGKKHIDSCFNACLKQV